MTYNVFGGTLNPTLSIVTKGVSCNCITAHDLTMLMLVERTCSARNILIIGCILAVFVSENCCLNELQVNFSVLCRFRMVLMEAAAVAELAVAVMILV